MFWPQHTRPQQHFAVGPQAPHPTNASGAYGSLVIKRRRFAVESVLAGSKINIFRNSMRKNVDNFMYDQNRNALVAQGPRKLQPVASSFVCAFGNSGFFLAVGDSPEACDEQLAWLRRKHKGVSADTVDIDHRLINYSMQCETAESEIRVFELYCFLKHHFPDWTIVYSPDVSPYLCVQRRQEPGVQTRDRLPLQLPPHLLSSLTPLQKAVYDLKLREAAEDAAASQMLRFSNSSAPPDASQLYPKTGRQCIFILDARNLILHNNTDEQETQQAWSSIMPIVHWFITPTTTQDRPLHILNSSSASSS